MAPTARIDVLERDRRLLKKQILKHTNEIQAELKKQITSALLYSVKATFEIIVEKKQKFEQIQDEVLVELSNIDKEEERDKVEKNWEEASEQVDLAIRDAKGKFEFANANQLSKQSRESILGSTCVNQPGEQNDSGLPQPKLPSIEIPTFSGNLREFAEFKSLFENLVHKNTSISNVQKLYYLKKSVSGTAAELIKDIALSDTAYAEAWSSLCSRYNNKKAIIRAYFLDLVSMQKIKDRSGLRKTLDDIDRICRGLRIVGENPDNMSSFLAFWLLYRLDDENRREFEIRYTDNEKFPKYETVRAFLSNRALAEEERVNEQKESSNSKPRLEKKAMFASKEEEKRIPFSIKCYVCNAEHRLYKCSMFLSKTPEQRYGVCREKKLCLVCFSNRHISAQCEGRKCEKCQKKHNTLLHREEQKPPDSVNTTSTTACNISSSSEVCVLMPTAVGELRVYGKKPVFVRMLFDSGSQVTFITRSLVDRLKLPTVEFDNPTCIRNMNNASFECTHSCSFELRSRVSDFKIEIEADVVPHINYTADGEQLKRIRKNHGQLCLAERDLNGGQVDLLIGAGYLERCFEGEIVRDGTLSLRKSWFGYVASGVPPSDSEKIKPGPYCHLSTKRLEKAVRQLWEVQEATGSSEKTLEHDLCNRHFTENVSRDEHGRFVVSLPLKSREEVKKLSKTKEIALRSLIRQERNLLPEVKAQYNAFMAEYISLGHMERLPIGALVDHEYFIPHRAVLRPDSSTTKLRVVFNATCRAGGAVSLNDILLNGPKTQPDLVDIVVKFREYKFAAKADIQMMYRQIFVKKEDRNLQLILWRSDPNNQVEAYRLKTVTYGTGPASFLATKCLEVLGQELEKTCPRAGRMVQQNFYMDDLLMGANTEEELIELRDQIHRKLASAGLPLRKYASNSLKLLSCTEDSLLEKGKNIEIADKSDIATLGLNWIVEADRLKVKANLEDIKGEITKRAVLSFVARQYDPLGFLLPVSIRGRIIFQEIWLENVDWDDPVSEKSKKEFVEYCSDLCGISSWSIDRECVKICGKVIDRSLVGFCDASNKAYCAVVFVRYVNEEHEVATGFVCARARVAPIKSLSIPRLELQSASLLAELLSRVSKNLDIDHGKVFAFSDSKIALGWIRGNPDRWKMFVANRVEKIVSLVEARKWYYVPTTENPADLATRGIRTDMLVNSSLWFQGPAFLKDPNFLCERNQPIETVNLPESKRCALTNVKVPTCFIEVSRFSSFNRLLNSVAYVLRFFYRKRKSTLVVTSDERNEAFYFLIKRLQYLFYPVEMNLIAKGEICDKFKMLDPFIDVNGVLRVQGRLQNSSFSFSRRHPVIVPAKCNMMYLFVSHIHVKYFHAEHLFVMSVVRNTFWPVGNIRKVVKSVLYSCVVCKRFRGRPFEIVMGQLPADRTEISRPFAISGVDFAGPFSVKCQGHRALKLNKAYVAVFVCFCTRAVHLEIVPSLTSVDFIAALRRFFGRRGVCNTLYSDNATNFVGAERALVWETDKNQDLAATLGFKWRFIPPRTPHFGGLWEAAVKSFKSHFVKVCDGSCLTYAELETLAIRIEAVLNDRPICYRFVESSEVEALTPAHFLVGGRLNEVPVDEDCEMSLGARWLEMQRKLQLFRKKWRSDYLAQLQMRSKWHRKDKRKPAVDDVVLIKEDWEKSKEWSIGRIVKVFPGIDGQVRVADVRVGKGVRRRPIIKLIPLVNAKDLAYGVLPVDGQGGGEC